MVYAEVTTLKDWFFQDVLHYELYDMRVDEFQLHNIYSEASPGLLAELHASILKMYACKGAECP